MYESCNEPNLGIEDSAEQELYHEGVGHLDGGNSGRYPWGSGDKSFQRPKDFYSFVEKQKRSGLSIEDIAKSLEMSVTDFQEAYKESYRENYKANIINNAKINKSKIYPWGKDKKFKTPNDFRIYVKNRKKEVKEKELIEELGLKSEEYRAFYALSSSIVNREKDYEIRKLAFSIDPDTGKQYTREKIGAIVGNKYDGKPIIESSIRARLNNSGAESKQNASVNAAILIMKRVDEYPEGHSVDVGKGTGPLIGITDDKMKEALKICEAEGYYTHHSRMPMAGQKGKTITNTVIHKGDPENKKIAYDLEHIHSIEDFVSEDNGKTFKQRYVYPKAMNKNRIMIRYADPNNPANDGRAKDGLIEIREGVPDLTMGTKRYCQARILVDNGGGENDLYLKGMAVYSDGKDMPKGVDIIFNTNKTKDVPFDEVLKSVKPNLEKDKSNPFSANIKLEKGQTWYPDPNGDHTDPITGEKISLSLVNKTAEEGDWHDWGKNLPSQFLSKQPLRLMKKQINESVARKENEYNELVNLNNYAVRKKLLNDFAEQCDRDAVDLQASSFDGTYYHVLLPSATLKPNEIYAPNYPDGTQLALVRFPHGGTFEIPVLTVNNKNKECRDMIGSVPTDAVCIPKSAASQLSGADFDGDTALCIPTNTSKGVIIQSTPRLIEEDWETGIYGPDINGKQIDSKGNTHYYRNGKEYKLMSEAHKQRQMGVISNLITDMTIQGAPRAELARAVKHSMVVIDAVKHELDYKQSEIDNGIEELKKTYQNKANGTHGATTILSRAGSPVKVAQRQQGAFVLNIKGHPDFGNNLTLVDPVKQVYLDEKTGKKYGAKDKKTINIDPKTGEKVYHDTMRMYYKAHVVNSTTGKKEIKDIYVKNKGLIPSTKEYIQPNYDIKFYGLSKDEPIYYLDKKSNKMIPISQTDKRIVATKNISEYSLMSLTKDAHTITSSQPEIYAQERYYADYANKLKSLANDARKEIIYAENHKTPYSPEARLKYMDEYLSLKMQCDKAALNAPKERLAQQQTNAIIAQLEKEQATPWTPDQKNRRIQAELQRQRELVGAKSSDFRITDKEWEAIQAGAITDSMLTNQILRFADSERLKQLATPRETKALTSAQISRIKGFAARGETTTSIARRLGISTSTVSKYLKMEDK